MWYKKNQAFTWAKKKIHPFGLVENDRFMVCNFSSPDLLAFAEKWMPAYQDSGWLLLLRFRPSRSNPSSRTQLCTDGTGYVHCYKVSQYAIPSKNKAFLGQHSTVQWYSVKVWDCYIQHTRYVTVAHQWTWAEPASLLLRAYKRLVKSNALRWMVWGIGIVKGHLKMLQRDFLRVEIV